MTVESKNNESSKLRTGAQCLIDGLKKANVDVLFGYPGGQALPIFDALLDSGIHFILPRHEQGGVHMADGYARSTGRVGCCLFTSGPGATNAVTGLATANMDGIPLVCICGQVNLDIIGNDAFQEADTTGITRSITKHNYLVRDVDDLPRIIAEAFFIASHGRPGPVLIDVPRNVQLAKTTQPSLSPDEVFIRGFSPIPDPKPTQMRDLATLIRKSIRPVLYIGGGIISAGATNELLAVAECAQIPVTSTLLGLGAFPQSHPLYLGMLGMHGKYVANKAVNECDLLICAGARFDDRVTGKLDAFAPDAHIVHIDIDRSEIGKSVRTGMVVHGDAKAVLAALLPKLREQKRPEWLAYLKKTDEENPLTFRENGEALSPERILQHVDAACKGEAIVVTDVGQNQMWAALFMTHLHPRHFLSSGGLGTMGYGLPAAIGAQIANPGKRVVCVTGDGGIQMNFQELVVAVEHRLPVKTIILNNGCLGMVRQQQELFFKKRYSASLINQFGRNRDEQIPDREGLYLPDFIKLAEAHGAKAARVTRPEEIDEAIARAFADDEPWVLEFIINPEENVLPMIPGGGTLEQIIR